MLQSGHFGNHAHSKNESPSSLMSHSPRKYAEEGSERIESQETNLELDEENDLISSGITASQSDEESDESKRSAYLRFGKRIPTYLRFGRTNLGYLRFGKRSPNSYLRFGRNPAYLRFGRSATQSAVDDLRKTVKGNNLNTAKGQKYFFS